ATVQALNLELMFCNTYHLLLQPGTEVVAKAGGLHSFINRSLPIITDSGGFQVFSLAYGSVADELKSKGTKKHANSVLKITEEGVIFRSYIDGRKVLLTPESSIAAQKDLGADIIITFDELPPYHISSTALHKSFERTHRWQERSLIAHRADPRKQALFAVVHGGIDNELRKQSCDFLKNLPFDGFAIGGSLGKNKSEMYELLLHAIPHLPNEAPRHLLGIGDLTSLDACIPLGLDTFDSSYPTKLARHGIALTARGPVNMTRGEQKADFSPLCKECPCYTCQNYSAAYLHHLFKAKELAAYSLATIHNIHFMVEKMRHVRQMILEDQI
ncbi:MAG: tRNA guanosine(34) transglycosylase Tgt, partial [Verrucomicrobia bacterium]|nr:tRNA guanosine(34) transglycosylase Tgt [Verrucomicrobiota bacterium]